jgi:hypothetical protein
MKPTNYLLIFLFLFSSTYGFAQKDLSAATVKHYPVRKLTIEPGVGIHTNFGTDILITTLVQWSPYKRLSLASHSSFNINNITQRDFNHIQSIKNSEQALRSIVIEALTRSCSW